MDSKPWTEGEMEPTESMSWEEGLPIIDAFYSSPGAPHHESEDQTRPQGAATQNTESSIVMIDIDPLTHAADPKSHMTPDTAANRESAETDLHHPYASVQMSSGRDTHDATHTSPHESSLSGALPCFELQQESIIHRAAFTQPFYSSPPKALPASSMKLAARNVTMGSQEYQLEPSSNGASKKTAPKNDDPNLPSSEGKSFMMDEMRSEERYPQSSASKFDVPMPNRKIRLPGIDAREDEEDSELINDDLLPRTDATSKSISVQTKLRDAATSPNASDEFIDHDVPQSGMYSQAQNGHGKDVKEEARDPVVKTASKKASMITRTERKKSNSVAEPDYEIAEDIGRLAKKAKTKGEMFVSTAANGTAPNPKPPRRSLSKNEMKNLTASPLLGSIAPPQRRSSARQTRAQKADEAKQAPNAGRAAKERHNRTSSAST